MKNENMCGKLSNTENFLVDKGKAWPQILAIAIGSLTSLSMGMAFSWTSPSLPKIVEDKENYDISEEETTYFSLIPVISLIITAPLFSQLADIFGRKKILLLVGIINIVTWILISFARDIIVFYIARFISGMSDACIFCVLPMYVGEISTPEVRGMWGNLLTFNIYLGQLLINVIGSYLSIPNTAYVMMVIPIIFLITFPFMPESIYFYIMKGRYDDARKALKWLRRKNDIENDFQQLKLDVERQISESGTWIDLFKFKSNRRALCAGIFLRTIQQMGGISALVVYTQYIFIQAGSDLSASTSAIIFCLSICVLNVFASMALDKLGRRMAFMLSCLTSGIVLFCMSMYFFFDSDPDIDTSSFKWVPLAGMMLFVLFYSFGLGIVPTLMLGELFSASIKVKGLCVLSMMFGVNVGIVTQIFYILNVNFGMFSPFLLFSIFCLIGTLLTTYFVPETKGKTLEEIQQILKGNKKH